MIPKILHSIWIGNSIPSLDIQRCLQSQSEMHPAWKICEWSEHNAPTLTCPLSSHAATSNVIRLWALYEYGGLYLDVDVEVLKPFDSLLEHEAFFARQPDGIPCNAVLGATPKHPWIGWMLDKAVKEQEFNDPAWACHMIESSPREGVAELPTDYFYSWSFNEEPKPASPNAYALHHFVGSWIPKPEEMSWP